MTESATPVSIADKYHSEPRARNASVSSNSDPHPHPHHDRNLKIPYSSSPVSNDRRASIMSTSSVSQERRDSVMRSSDGLIGALPEEQRVELEIQMLKPNGWKMVKSNLRRIVEYGHREGILTGDVGPLAGQSGGNAAGQNDDDNLVKADKHEDDVIKIATRDLSLIHAAIPFLPVPVAAFCFFMNIVGPGTGTILSGFCGVCMGQPRINLKEGRRFTTLIINFLVGIAQLGTITFFLVGWFWSMAWGGLLLSHSLKYREALVQHRQEAVATAAIEALTRDAILRRRDVRTLVQERKQEQGAAAALEYNRRRSMFTRLGKIGKTDSVRRAPNGNAAV